jgi:hypothetical protein
MNKVHSKRVWAPPVGRGRPPKSRVDTFRERVLRTVISQLPRDAPKCRFDQEAVLKGGALSQAREQRISECHPVFQAARRWPFQLLEVRTVRHSRLRALIETYELDPADLLPSRRIELPAASDEHVIFFPDRAPDTLLRRGDLYGYLALLTQFRLSLLQGDTTTQWITARYLVRSISGACLHTAIRPHARTLIVLTMRILSLLPHPCVPVRIDRHNLCELIRSGEAYRDRSIDPLVHYSVQACQAEQATLLWPRLSRL